MTSSPLLDALLSQAPNLPDVWGEGALFAFSGVDGETCAASGFVATFAAEPFSLLIHTPQRRILDLRLPEAGAARLATGDVFGAVCARGEMIVGFTAWHTLAGSAPAGTLIRLRAEDRATLEQREGCACSHDPAADDWLALAQRAETSGTLRFALAYGKTAAEACQRAAAGLTASLLEAFTPRLAFYRRLPALPEPARDRLLKKCASVMKVNTLAAEGLHRQAWSTPDRVPHKDMWLWDTVFHSLAMNRIDPRLSWQILLSMLASAQPDGMIPHQVSVSGRKSGITQPPLLAWGVWENFLALQDRACLQTALPILERYLEWDLAQRDQNGNSLLEWYIEGDPFCRSGESGMDNSPRFDPAATLDAVDFSVFAAQDCAYLSRIASVLGLAEKAARWQERSARISSQVHRLLWDESAGFYFDRQFDGSLTGVWAVSGFLPLLLADLPAGRAARLAQAMRDPARFGAAFPLPSAALSEPTWSTDMWRGATWINFNYLVILGLRRQGQAELAQELAEKTIRYVNKYYEQFGVLFEFFDAKDERTPPECDRKGARRPPYDIRRKMDSIRDYHWTAALTACLLI